MKIEVEQHGATEAALNLAELGVRARDVRPVGRRVGKVVADSNERRFQGAGRWKKLDADTAERKSREGLDPRILRSSGALHRQLTSTKPREESPDQLVYGTDLFYARFADKGTKNEPKRKLISLRAAERAEITDIIGRFVVQRRRR